MGSYSARIYTHVLKDYPIKFQEWYISGNSKVTVFEKHAKWYDREIVVTLGVATI